MNPNDELFVLKTESKSEFHACSQVNSKFLKLVFFLLTNYSLSFSHTHTHTRKTLSEDQSFSNLIQSL